VGNCVPGVGEKVTEGDAVGPKVGSSVGFGVGTGTGSNVGIKLGNIVGAGIGDGDGAGQKDASVVVHDVDERHERAPQQEVRPNKQALHEPLKRSLG
jgi:hypothetical protein